MRSTKSIRSKRVKRPSRSIRSKRVKRPSRSIRSKGVKRQSRSRRSKRVKRSKKSYKLKGGVTPETLVTDIDCYFEKVNKFYADIILEKEGTKEQKVENSSHYMSFMEKKLGSYTSESLNFDNIVEYVEEKTDFLKTLDFPKGYLDFDKLVTYAEDMRDTVVINKVKEYTGKKRTRLHLLLLYIYHTISDIDRLKESAETIVRVFDDITNKREDTSDFEATFKDGLGKYISSYEILIPDGESFCSE